VGGRVRVEEGRNWGLLQYGGGATGTVGRQHKLWVSQLEVAPMSGVEQQKLLGAVELP
jgi:hypothetical protein